MTKQNYELLIGKKFGDREILDIVKKHDGRWNQTYAICKCKCGSIDEVPLHRLKAGKQLRCSKCADANENKSTGVKNISYDRFANKIIVTIERNGQKVVRRVNTIDEAILTKKHLLKHFEKFGCFDVEKLKELYTTSKCSVLKAQKKSKKHEKVRKDYSHLIGQKLGDYEIISVSEPIKEKRSQRVVQMRSNNDEIREVMLKNALRALRRDKRRAYHVKSNTDIKNISYNKWLKYYQVQITRNGVTKTGSSKNLEEAIKIKEKLLNEFEKEGIAND